MNRSCLHCVLARVLGAEGDRIRARGLEVRLSPAAAVFLPAPGRATYRALRGLLRSAIGDAEGPRIRLTLVNLPGKSHVEVMAAFSVARGTRVLSCAFPRHDPAALAAGILGQ